MMPFAALAAIAVTAYVGVTALFRLLRRLHDPSLMRGRDWP
jgi:hypothetical protein